VQNLNPAAKVFTSIFCSCVYFRLF